MDDEAIKYIEAFLEAKFYSKQKNKYYFVKIPILSSEITSLVTVYEIDVEKKMCIQYMSCGRLQRNDIGNDFYMEDVRNILGW